MWRQWKRGRREIDKKILNRLNAWISTLSIICWHSNGTITNAIESHDDTVNVHTYILTMTYTVSKTECMCEFEFVRIHRTLSHTQCFHTMIVAQSLIPFLYPSPFRYDFRHKITSTWKSLSRLWPPSASSSIYFAWADSPIKKKREDMLEKWFRAPKQRKEKIPSSMQTRSENCQKNWSI